jgi:hypothetical protein
LSDEHAPGVVLRSSDALRVELSIAGYQFPLETRDALNWLMIAGEVSHPRGSWSFLDPALETDEVEALCDWFERVAAAPTVAQPAMLFIEPNIQLRYCADEFGGSIAVRLAHESAPPWCESRDARLTGVELMFSLATNDLLACAETLRAQLASYPSRE